MSLEIQDLLKKAYIIFNEQNEQKSQILQDQQKYKDFLKWFTENGGIYKDIQFPSAFGKIGYVGIVFTNNVSAHTVFLAIPNKLIISTKMIKQSELGMIIDENPDLFDEEQNQDADFNILALFVMKERNKGADSFYNQWFNITDESYSMYSWSEQELDKLDDSIMKSYAIEFQDDICKEWEQFKNIIEKYPELFPKKNQWRDIFQWSFEYVMTRCYGWSLPSSMLVPFADCLNHDIQQVDHCILDLNKEKQKLEEEKYNLKREKVNLDILGIKGNKKYHSWKNDLIKKNDKINSDLELIGQHDIRDQVNQINFDRLKNDDDLQIFNINFNLSSDEEDNDTESESDENEQSTFEKCRQEELYKQNFRVSKEDIDKIIFQEKSVDEDEDDLEDNNWDWYDHEQNDQYFIMYTKNLQKKNEQVYYCYGRRSNKFLILWYGFAILNNKYDSFPFRLNLSNAQKFEDKEFLTEEYFHKIYFQQHIPFDKIDSENCQLEHNGQLLQYEDISKEFKFKKLSFPSEILDFFRLNYLTNCSDYEIKQNLFSIPSDLKVELKVIIFAKKFLQNILKTKTPVEDDIKELNKLMSSDDFSANKYFACIYRLQQKEILLKNEEIFTILENILLKCIQTGNLKEAYSQMQNIENNQQEFIQNRIIIQDYLRYLQVGLLIQ